MNDITQRIAEIVADTMAAKQAEVATLLDKLREDIDALQQAVGDFPGSQQPAPRRAPRPAAPTTRRQRKRVDRAPTVQAAQPAASGAPAPRKRREKTPEERDAISKRMSAYWQRKREEKAAQG
jgi:hypothetical protein